MTSEAKSIDYKTCLGQIMNKDMATPLDVNELAKLRKTITKEIAIWLTSMEKTGNGWILFEIAYLYSANGLLGKSKGAEKKSAEYHERAAEGGNVYAMQCLAGCYYMGKGVKRDMTQCYKWNLKAAELGNPDAMANLATLYCNGFGVKRNFDEALKWNNKGADIGHQGCLFNLGLAYVQGFGVKKNVAKGFEYHIKAAGLGCVPAMSSIGAMYYEGRDIEPDYKKAYEWFVKAATYGDMGAMMHLFIMCSEGSPSGQEIQPNPSKAFFWATKAYEINPNDPYVAYNLSLCYTEGIGTPKDEAKGTELLELAEKNGLEKQ